MSEAATLEQWSWIGTIASSVFSFLALGAVILAWLQLRASQTDASMAEANAIQRSLIEKSMEFPQFVLPHPDIVDVEAGKFNGSEVEFRRYETFVELVLTTFDHLVSAYSDQPTRKYMIQTLAEHRKYLDSGYFRREFRDQLSSEVTELVEAGIKFDEQRAAERELTKTSTVG
jgi:hypothetical protein